MKKTKSALFNSMIALLLCAAMLLGTTFAWFTDEVTSTGNIIKTGTLDVKMTWSDKVDGTYKDASEGAIFNYSHWEPGYVDVKYVKIENVGSLAFKFRLDVIPASEARDGEVNLADVIDVYIFDATADVNRAAIDAAEPVGTMSDLMADVDGAAYGILLPATGVAAPNAELNAADANFAVIGSVTYCIVLKMQEDAGNEYQDKKLGNGFAVQLLATQYGYEQDSFGSDYDTNAAADFFPGFQGGSAGVAVVLDDQGMTTVDAAMDGGDVSAIIPAGVQVANGTNSLGLTVALKNSSDSNVQVGENEEMRSLDVHIEGVAEGNTVPMLITLKQYLTTGINTGALRLYHVENGVTVPMTQVATPVNHNEFSYDPATGDVTLALASFSEVAVVADTNNPWDGETLNYLWYDASATELTIYNADQLAGFGAIVDGKAEGIAQDNFAGKTVKLNNNIYLSGKLFDPIGWGYVNTQWNSGGAAGNVFQGTFDGNGKTIFDLYQSGWDLEEKTGTDYTYTNCGFGLFAAASNATFMDLTISGAYVRVECVEAGVLVGLSQNSCTYQNIKILNSKVANYQRPAGGLIGEVSGDGTTTITDVTIGDDVVVGSLWGDFDAPVGGVIGAYWNDVNEDPEIYMTNLDVGCRLDVYNDITSAYQWHAYRRAGMLIGNTDMSDPNNAHKAYAPFLHCSDVRVHYGDWVNYTYCSFSNHNERYPWVRTQAGENCTAFSNPRWGVPNDIEGNRVTDMNHVHAEGDECNVLRQFSQLYGGGQGVYGQDKHDGVTYPENAYSITYINDGKTLDVVYVPDNKDAYPVGSDQAKKLVDEWAIENMKDYNGYTFGGWMTSASVKLDKIPAGNDKNIVLYPYFTSPYTASFVDENSNILAWCFFNEVNVDNLSSTFAEAKQNRTHPGDDYELLYWVVRGKDTNGNTFNVQLTDNYTDWNSFKGYKDVTITPHYKYKGADLIEVYDELTGEIDHYQVAGYGSGLVSTVVEIPAYVNGKPVTEINANAFSSYDKLHVVVIPKTVDTIGNKAISDQGAGAFTKQETVTIYYEGSYEEWKAKNYGDDWITGLGEDSRVFFLNGGDTVDTTVYLQVKHYDWDWSGRNYKFEEMTNVTDLVGDYYANCQNCGVDGCEGNLRPDAVYWAALANP